MEVDSSSSKRRKIRRKKSQVTDMDVDTETGTVNASQTSSSKGKGKERVEEEEADEDDDTAISAPATSASVTAAAADDIPEESHTHTRTKSKKRRKRKARQNEADVDSGVGLESFAVTDDNTKAPPISGDADRRLPVSVGVEEKKDTSQSQKKRRRLKRKEKKEKTLAAAAALDALLPHNPDPKPEENGIESLPWDWVPIADPSYNTLAPTYSKDGKYFFLPSGSSVKIYSTSTHKPISLLSPPSRSKKHTSGGHTSRITAAVLNPTNEFQLITASTDGRIKVWDYMDCALLATYNVGKPIMGLCVLGSESGGEVLVNVLKHRTEKVPGRNTSLILRLSLRSSKSKSKETIPAQTTRLAKLPVCSAIALSPSGEWLVAISGEKVFVIPTSGKETETVYTSPNALTCLAFHPKEDLFVTGDEKGQIRIWYTLLSTSPSHTKKRQRETKMMHWHAHAVSSLAFSPNGAYLLSGGMESVLVVWALEGGGREYVPRLGAPVVWVTSSIGGEAGLEYVVGLKDGTIVCVDGAGMRVSPGRSIAQLKLDPEAHTPSDPLPLSYHTPTRTLILPSSHPSSLQIYAPHSQTLLSELEISPSNRISSEPGQVVEAKITLVRVSKEGKWMITVDTRGEEEVYMKFWAWTLEEGWGLNTRIDNPHGEGKRVRDLCFVGVGEKEGRAVSCGEDGCVKVWRVESGRGKAGSFWSPHTTHLTRSRSPLLLSPSADGSLLAVVQSTRDTQTYLTLHLPSSNLEVVQTISCPEIKAVRYIAFCGERGKYVILCGGREVVVWDVVKGRVHYSYTSPDTITHLLPHASLEKFFVMVSPWMDDSADKDFAGALLFDLSGLVGTRSIPFRMRSVSLIGGEEDGGWGVVGISDRWRVVLFGDKDCVKDLGPSSSPSSRSGPIPAEVSTRRNLFEDIFGREAFAQPNPNPTSTPARLVDASGSALELFDEPGVGGMESIWEDVIRTFLIPRSEADEPQPSPAEEEEESMDVDAEERDETQAETYREVSKDEMKELEELFRGMPVPAVPGRPTPTSPVTNGKVTHNSPKRANGIAIAAVTGALSPRAPTRTTRSTKGTSPQKEKEIASVVESVEGSPPRTGSKRKNI